MTEKEIKEFAETYSKAFEKLVNWYYREDAEFYSTSKGYVPIVFKSIKLEERYLYDFFDRHRIMIGIIYQNNSEQKTGFHVEINTIFECEYGHRWYKHYYKTRQQAEEIAFKKAFEILENKLRGEICLPISG